MAPSAPCWPFRDCWRSRLRARPTDGHPLLAEQLDRRLRLLRPSNERLAELSPLLASATAPASALVLLLRSSEPLDGLLLLRDVPPNPVSPVDAEVATVLSRICQEAATVMGAQVAVVYRGSAGEDLVLSASHGMPPEAVGWTMPPGTGLSGKVGVQGRAMLTNDRQRIAALPEGRRSLGTSTPRWPRPWSGTASCAACSPSATRTRAR